MHLTFDQQNFHSICDKLARKDRHLFAIIRQCGYPPRVDQERKFSNPHSYYSRATGFIGFCKSCIKQTERKNWDHYILENYLPFPM